MGLLRYRMWLWCDLLECLLASMNTLPSFLDESLHRRGID